MRFIRTVNSYKVNCYIDPDTNNKCDVIVEHNLYRKGFKFISELIYKHYSGKYLIRESTEYFESDKYGCYDMNKPVTV